MTSKEDKTKAVEAAKTGTEAEDKKTKAKPAVEKEIKDEKPAESKENGEGDENKADFDSAYVEDTKDKAEDKNETSGDASKPKPAEDSLIISAEEEEELCNATDETNEENKKQAASKEETASKKKKDNAKSVWVSNITRTTKAAELKKLFSKHGKVITARIVTNGKSFFGYISLETAEMASNCVKLLNGSKIDGRKIAISLQRPDLRASNRSETSRRKEPASRSDSKSSSVAKKVDEEKKPEEKPEEEATKKSEEGSKKDAGEKKELTDEEKAKREARKKEDTERLIRRLKRELDESKREVVRYKRRLNDSHLKMQSAENRSLKLRRDLDKVEEDVRLERRRLAQEKDALEKKKRLDDIRYEADKAMLNKEIDECKKLREYLQSKINELSNSARKHKSRSRSPRSQKVARLQVQGPPKRRYDNKEGNRSPPPPPKLSNHSPRRGDRSPDYMMGKSKRMRSEIVMAGGYSQNSNASSDRSGVRPLLQAPSSDHSREGPWGSSSSYQPNPWRYGPSHGGHQQSNHSTTYPSSYGGGSGSYGQSSMNQKQMYFNEYGSKSSGPPGRGGRY